MSNVPTHSFSRFFNASGSRRTGMDEDPGFLIARPTIGLPLVIVFEQSGIRINTTNVIDISHARDGRTTHIRTNNSTYQIDARSLMVTAKGPSHFDAMLSEIQVNHGTSS